MFSRASSSGDCMKARRIPENWLSDKRKRSEPGRTKNSRTAKRSSSAGAFEIVGVDLLLYVVHHCYGNNQNYGCNDLVRVKAGMKEAPGDADCGEGLQHFKIAHRGCARDVQPLKINQQRNPA